MYTWLTVGRVVDGGDRHMMRLQLHLHLGGGQAEDSQCAIAVSRSHTRAFLPGERAPTYTAAALERDTGSRKRILA